MSARGRSLSMRDVKAHKSKESHPGGAYPLLCNAGDDATQAFADAGHSCIARELLKTMEIGTLNSNMSACKRYWPWVLAAVGVALLVGGLVMLKYYT